MLGMIERSGASAVHQDRGMKAGIKAKEGVRNESASDPCNNSSRD